MHSFPDQKKNGFLWKQMCFPRPTFTGKYSTMVVVVDVNNLKNSRKPVKLQKENPAGYAGEGKQSKGN